MGMLIAPKRALKHLDIGGFKAKIFIGTYHDIFAKDGGAWYFVERAITPDLIGDMSRHRADMA